MAVDLVAGAGFELKTPMWMLHASGQTPSLAFRLPQGLQATATAELYKRAGSEFLRNCRAIAWWREYVSCVRFGQAAPAARDGGKQRGV